MRWVLLSSFLWKLYLQIVTSITLNEKWKQWQITVLYYKLLKLKKANKKYIQSFSVIHFILFIFNNVMHSLTSLLFNVIITLCATPLTLNAKYKYCLSENLFHCVFITDRKWGCCSSHLLTKMIYRKNSRWGFWTYCWTTDNLNIFNFHQCHQCNTIKATCQTRAHLGVSPRAAHAAKLPPGAGEAAGY